MASSSLLQNLPSLQQALRNPKLLLAVGAAYLLWQKWKRLRALTRSRHTLLYDEEKLALQTSQVDATDPLCSPLRAQFPQYMVNRQGLWLYHREWIIPNPRALVFLCHGLGEHIDRYSHLASKLNDCGFSVYGLDHQGHGCSQGDRTFVERFTDYVDDYVQYVKGVQTDFELKQAQLPVFLVGHSMGGTISFFTALRSKSANLWPWRGVVLSCPCFEVDPRLATPLKKAAASWLSHILPKMQLDEIDAKGISRDPLIVQNYKQDPLIYHGGVPVRTAFSLMKALDDIRRNAHLFDWPVLVLQGAADPIVYPEGARQFHQDARSADKTLRLLNGFLHEIFNDPERAVVFKDVIDWMAKRL